MRVRFNVHECCPTDLRRHCHRCPLYRHSRIRRRWMLCQPFPCRQRRHEGHPFGTYDRPRESQHHRCEMRCHPRGLRHRLYEWLREFLGQTFMETSLAPGGCCSLSTRSRWVLPRQLDPSDRLSSTSSKQPVPF